MAISDHKKLASCTTENRWSETNIHQILNSFSSQVVAIAMSPWQWLLWWLETTKYSIAYHEKWSRRIRIKILNIFSSISCNIATAISDKKTPQKATISRQTAWWTRRNEHLLRGLWHSTLTTAAGPRMSPKLHAHNTLFPGMSHRTPATTALSECFYF